MRNNVVPAIESVLLTSDAIHEPLIEAIALAAVCTRAYVKNVLAFTYIFSEHLNRNMPFLSENEAASLPRYMLTTP